MVWPLPRTFPPLLSPPASTASPPLLQFSPRSLARAHSLSLSLFLSAAHPNFGREGDFSQRFIPCQSAQFTPLSDSSTSSTCIHTSLPSHNTHSLARSLRDIISFIIIIIIIIYLCPSSLSVIETAALDTLRAKGWWWFDAAAHTTCLLLARQISRSFCKGLSLKRSQCEFGTALPCTTPRPAPKSSTDDLASDLWVTRLATLTLFGLRRAGAAGTSLTDHPANAGSEPPTAARE